MSRDIQAILAANKGDFGKVRSEIQAATVSGLMRRYDVTESCVKGWEVKFMVSCRREAKDVQFQPPWNANKYFTANGAMGGAEVRSRLWQAAYAEGAS